ncbi:ribose-phosphate diphosphokinase [Vulcanisaeta thermophila]|uniref:ribose-phosphate diphosphokinase n=1 Tax=Vulcanisaeta thermophila TaxID=867917 RepID=UPI0008529B58|nr:ribose-phosphate diphosphokinase [Vulcanisaeta thermophila]
MPRYIIVSFPWSSDLGERVRNHLVSRGLAVDHVVLETKQFPDGESYIRYPVNVGDYESAVIIQRAYPEQDRRLIQLVLAIHAALDLGVKHVHVVLPYMPYSRQDRRFRDGEPVSLTAVKQLLNSLNVESLITVDVHKPEAFMAQCNSCINLEPFPLYADYIMRNWGGEPIVLLSPDLGSLWRVERVSKHHGLSYSYLEKFRDRVTGEVTMRPREIDVKGRDVVVIDDIIATGGTIVEASKILKSLGANKLHVIATHCLLLNNADSRILSSGASSITCTDTIPTKYSSVSIAGLISDALLSRLLP